ncbi:class I SAM-dependent methyltransferase [Endozoicomonas sp. SM1973]|uniref:Class I SAM-dependent methyltransferase n=1 Tax=Spartinivicinus marinus TaxID=2994442 RepID=A0A853IBT5_9GAMM|nr:class I SAM-dependent methyltransferase [Spartinivicinus marinus]MCX4029900.1 class I SAM-dependent methyltransferase [Spartinivicinus marinus]NYZ64856.1 class I SAM-dependent methyltransferase [Spartinivicinus marinus]
MNNLVNSKPHIESTEQLITTTINQTAQLSEKSLLSLIIKSKNCNDPAIFLANITFHLLKGNVKGLSQILAKSTHIKSSYLINLRDACMYLCNRKTDDIINTVIILDKMSPPNPLLAVLVAEAQYIQCKFTEAFYNFSKAANNFTFNKQLIIKARQCLQHIEATKYSEPLVQGAIDYLKDDRFDSKEIATLITSLIQFKYQLTEKQTDTISLDLNDITQDEFLIEALQRIIIIDPDIELFLLAVRNNLLNTIVQLSEIPQHFTKLLCALALQGYMNEYVSFISNDEASTIDSIQQITHNLLKESNTSIEQIAGLVLLVSLYEPISQQPYFEQLLHYSLVDWPQEMQPCIEKILYQQYQEAALAKTIPQLTAIDNPVSSAVKAQYEENPYPRWTEVTQLKSPCNYIKYYHIDKPPFTKPKFSTKSLKMLVAGCGTGKHPISQALLFPDLQIIAVDLSSRSLAYAKLMADHFKIKNISFYQGDILQLNALKEKFHIIECVGVLHHMERPADGLAVLRELLVKQGVMKLGLYSQTARQEIEKFRASNELTPTLANIRQFRYRALTEERSKFDTCIKVSDFYSTSMCRDLLFHAQEHRYTTLEIAKLLKDHSLAFRGFYFRSHELFTQFQKLFPNPASMLDLTAWDQFEQQNPFAFLGMYQFFAQAL